MFCSFLVVHISCFFSMDIRPRCKSGISKLRFIRPPKVYRQTNLSIFCVARNHLCCVQTDMPSELGARRVCNTANFKRVTYIMCRRFLYRQTRKNFVHFLKGSMQVLLSSNPSASNNTRRIASFDSKSCTELN